MSWQLWLGVLVGAALGAPTRFFVDRRLNARFGLRFPHGTMVVNMVGCALLGLIMGYAARNIADGQAQPQVFIAVAGTGFCGALTTFSGFAAQVLDFERPGGTTPQVPFGGVQYAVVSVVTGVILTALGYAWAS